MKRLFSFLLIFLLLAVFPAKGQIDQRFRDAFVFRKLEGRGGIPLYWDGFIFGQYAGTTRDCIFYNYTGSGQFIVRLQGDGANVFTINKAGDVVSTGSIVVSSIGLLDTDASNELSLVWNENDTNDRILNFLVGSGNRSLTFNENFTISNGTNITMAGEDNDGTFTLDNATFEAENVNATQRAIKIATGTNADATITVEGTAAVVNQDTTSDAAVGFATVDTGQGANELYGMNQDVLSSSSPNFLNLTLGDNSDNDFSITFDSDTSNGVINYDEDNAEFEFDQDVIVSGEVISTNEDFIQVGDIVPTGDGGNNATVEVRIADPTNRRLFNRSSGISDTQDMDWYAEKAVNQTPTSLTLWTRASDFANCIMTMTISDQSGNADATGAVVITPTGNDTWEEFTYTFTSTYDNDEEIWILTAITSLDTADTADFSRYKIIY